LDEVTNRLSYWKKIVYGRTKIKTYIGEIINSGRDILNSAIDSAKFQSPRPAPMPKPDPIKINKQPFDFTQNQVQLFQKIAHGAPNKMLTMNPTFSAYMTEFLLSVTWRRRRCKTRRMQGRPCVAMIELNQQKWAHLIELADRMT